MAAYGTGYQTAYDPYARAESILQRHVEAVANRASGAASEAKICWGESGNFTISDTLTSSERDPSVTNLWPDDSQPDDTPPVVWTEIARTWGDEVRVENPDDADQYVMVQDVDDITFLLPDNSKIKQVFTGQRSS